MSEISLLASAFRILTQKYPADA